MTPIPIRIGDVIQLPQCSDLCGVVKQITPGQHFPQYADRYDEKGHRLIECVAMEIADYVLVLEMLPSEQP